MSEQEQVGGSGSARVRSSDEDFLRSFLGEHVAAKKEDRVPSISNIADALGMAETSVRQRATVLRKVYPDLPTFPRGASAKKERDPQLLANIMAELSEESDDSEESA